MTIAYLATGDALAALRHRGSNRWETDLSLQGRPTQCVAGDPADPETVYCGTFGQGLWRSDDAGTTWTALGGEALYLEVTAVAPGKDGVVWAGTEPSTIFRSDDRGATWREQRSLRELPSAPTWSFPPRPWTSHVRWIAPDPHLPERLFAGIELGGVMRSLDGGETWEDRPEEGLHDAHTLRVHRLAPDRVFESAGGGFAESSDAGKSWEQHNEGLTRRYVWGLALDPGDPDVMVVSAAPGPTEAHNPQFGEAGMY
ncbi:MAG: glycosyl hydrolase, partial [Chloroflexota bacterium]|nr:glycosyl hydrolase [Chloroflexota bacterium]